MEEHVEPLLQAIERSNTPIYIGAFLSFVGTGVLAFQTVSYLTEFRDSTLMRGSVLGLFLLCLLDATLDGHMLTLQNLHPGEIDYLTDIVYGPESRVGLFLSIIIVALCQAFLAIRSILFARAMSGGRLSLKRIALCVFVGFLIITTTTVGFLAQQSSFRDAFSCFYRSSATVFDDNGPHCPVPILNILWAGLSTLTDTILATVISLDLLNAKRKNDTEGHNHADVNSTSPILSKLISITRRNGSLIVFFQALCLLLYIFETTGWNSVIISVLPKIYCSSIVLYITSPRRLQRERLRNAELQLQNQRRPNLASSANGNGRSAGWSEGMCACSCCHHRTWIRERKRMGEGVVVGTESKGGGRLGGEGVVLRRDSRAGAGGGVMSQAEPEAENEVKLREGLNAAWLGGEKLSRGAGGGGVSGTTSIQLNPPSTQSHPRPSPSTRPSPPRPPPEALTNASARRALEEQRPPDQVASAGSGAMEFSDMFEAGPSPDVRGGGDVEGGRKKRRGSLW